MYNIILFENELKMEKFDLNIVQRNTWWQMFLPRHYRKNEARKPELLLCYDYHNGITDEEEDIIFVIEPKLFSIGIINLLDTIQFVKITYVGIMDIDVNTSISKQEFEV